MTQTAATAAPPDLGTTLAAGDNAESVNRLLTEAAYFSVFSVPSKTSPSQGVPLIPAIGQLASIAFTVHERMRRFEVHLPPPTDCGFHTTQQVGTRLVSEVSMQMTPMPNYYRAAYDRVPPPTVLLPFFSQRFCALKGEFEFLDNQDSRFRAFGAGRIFPTTVAGKSETRLSAAIDILEGFGNLAGLPGTGIVNGEIQPPSAFAFNVLFRIMDPNGTLRATTPVTPLVSQGDPAPDTVFLPFLSEPDPEQPLRFESVRNGSQMRVHLTERLRLADLTFSEDPLRSQTTPGAIVGRHTDTLILDTSRGTDVIPAYSQGGEFTFFDSRGKSVGGFKADLYEGRLFPTQLPGLSTPILRIGGFAPPTSGFGQFIDPNGMVSVNGALSLATGMVSTMYMVRLSDPYHVFRAASAA